MLKTLFKRCLLIALSLDNKTWLVIKNRLWEILKFLIQEHTVKKFGCYVILKSSDSVTFIRVARSADMVPEMVNSSIYRKMSGIFEFFEFFTFYM